MHASCVIPGMPTLPLNGGLPSHSPAHSPSKSPLHGHLLLSLSWARTEASPAWVWWESILGKCRVSGKHHLLTWRGLLALSFIEIHFTNYGSPLVFLLWTCTWGLDVGCGPVLFLHLVRYHTVFLKSLNTMNCIRS